MHEGERGLEGGLEVRGEMSQAHAPIGAGARGRRGLTWGWMKWGGCKGMVRREDAGELQAHAPRCAGARVRGDGSEWGVKCSACTTRRRCAGSKGSGGLCVCGRGNPSPFHPLPRKTLNPGGRTCRVPLLNRAPSASCWSFHPPPPVYAGFPPPRPPPFHLLHLTVSTFPSLTITRHPTHPRSVLASSPPSTPISPPPSPLPNSPQLPPPPKTSASLSQRRLALPGAAP